MLRVHFLNVGHGDCTIISHPSGRLTMIDINNSQNYDDESFNELLAEERQKARASQGLAALANSPLAQALGVLSRPPDFGVAGLSRSFAEDAALIEKARADSATEITDPIEFLKTHYPGKQIWRFILTHPDLDHMRGLARLHENVGFANFWDTSNTRSGLNFRGDADKEDWEFYQELRGGEVAGPNVHRFTQGDCRFAFNCDENGMLGGDMIDILSPTPEFVKGCSDAGRWNDLSIALRLRHGERSLLLPGDIEAEGWKELIRIHGRGLKSRYLKASHHGRDSGYDVDALKLIDPFITFVSVGRKPDTDASPKYRQQCPHVASTRFYGNMELRFEDAEKAPTWFVDRNADK